MLLASNGDGGAIPLIDGYCHSILTNFLESSMESFLGGHPQKRVRRASNSSQLFWLGGWVPIT
jgi:hypothetical protein